MTPHDSSIGMLPPELEETTDAAPDDEQPPESEPADDRIDAESATPPPDDVNLAIDEALEDGAEHDVESGPAESNVLADDADEEKPETDLTSSEEKPISDAPTKVSLAAPVNPPDDPGQTSAPEQAAPIVSDPPPKRSGGSFLLIFLASYASAATIALVYLITSMNKVDHHTLESLPDVEPLKPGQVELVPIDAGMPAGHVLRIGDSCRYGNILVEPLRVIEEPIEFVHFSGSSAGAKEATAPVVKLFVRFTNVSDDQTIAPLDRNLVFSQVVHDDGRLQTNQVVIPADGKQNPDSVTYLYSHPLTSEWDLAGQNVDTVLAPGEAVEMYLPTEPSAGDRLSGDLLWRIHFRKGFSPKGYGVTTVIEVAFNANDVQRSADS